jgi:preprotein translocase subunit YajC
MDLLAVALVAASSKTTSPSAGSSAASLIFIVIIGLAAYFLFIRPRSTAARRQRETLQEIVPGDEVLTGAGIFGTVLDVMDDRVTIETAPGTRITVLRSTIARRITQDTEVPEESWTDEDEHAAHDEAEGGAEHTGTGFEGSDDAEGHNGSHSDAESGSDATPDDDTGARHEGEDES